jgi:hypothetical protein
MVWEGLAGRFRLTPHCFRIGSVSGQWIFEDTGSRDEQVTAIASLIT